MLYIYIYIYVHLHPRSRVYLNTILFYKLYNSLFRYCVHCTVYTQCTNVYITSRVYNVYRIIVIHKPLDSVYRMHGDISYIVMRMSALHSSYSSFRNG